ncbi:hypothetical protein S40293_11492 [Stachybotrys chartarum IBT 40293]|nr:hypothetical protein S40293_11492 [Stachybotrys chartarum IBT 40293]
MLYIRLGDATPFFQDQNGQPDLQVYLPTQDAKKQNGMQLIQGDIKLTSGVWIFAPIISNTILVVNVGSTLEAMTDGLCTILLTRNMQEYSSCRSNSLYYIGFVEEKTTTAL